MNIKEIGQRADGTLLGEDDDGTLYAGRVVSITQDQLTMTQTLDGDVLTRIFTFEGSEVGHEVLNREGYLADRRLFYAHLGAEKAAERAEQSWALQVDNPPKPERTLKDPEAGEPITITHVVWEAV